MLSVVMLSVVMLSAVMLSAVRLGAARKIKPVSLESFDSLTFGTFPKRLFLVH
jgi:hypothetical protein